MNTEQVQLILDSLNLSSSKEVVVTIYMDEDHRRLIEISFFNHCYKFNNYKRIHRHEIELSTNEFNSLDLREYLLNKIETIRNNLLFI